MKIAVIGYGSIGKRHVQNLLTIPNTKIIICTKQKITNLPINKVKIVKSIFDCIKEEPDAAIIANESSFHVKNAIKLAKSGVDLFIEKPLSNSFLGTKELFSIIKKKKIVTQMGCQFRFHKCIKEIKHMISTNKLGKIVSASAECGSFLPEWHPYEDYTKSYAGRDDLGGGVVLTNIHEIDYLYWFFGDVSKVFSVTGKFRELKISADDLCIGILQFKNNVIAELHLDYFQKPDFRSFKAIGSKGTVIWDSNTNNVIFYDNKKNKWIKILKWTKYDRNSMFKEEMIHFLHCVKKRETTINPIEKDGTYTLKIALSIIKSSKSRKLVKI